MLQPAREVHAIAYSCKSFANGAKIAQDALAMGAIVRKPSSPWQHKNDTHALSRPLHNHAEASVKINVRLALYPHCNVSGFRGSLC